MLLRHGLLVRRDDDRSWPASSLRAACESIEPRPGCEQGLTDGAEKLIKQFFRSRLAFFGHQHRFGFALRVGDVSLRIQAFERSQIVPDAHDIPFSDPPCLCCACGLITEPRNSRSRRARPVVLALPLKNDAFLESSRRIEANSTNLCVWTSSASGATSDSVTRSDAEPASVRRRMRAVIGSSADECFWPVSLGRGFNRVGGLDCLDLLGQFGNARPFLFPRLLGRT